MYTQKLIDSLVEAKFVANREEGSVFVTRTRSSKSEDLVQRGSVLIDALILDFRAMALAAAAVCALKLLQGTSSENRKVLGQGFPGLKDLTSTKIVRRIDRSFVQLAFEREDVTGRRTTRQLANRLYRYLDAMLGRRKGEIEYGQTSPHSVVENVRRILRDEKWTAVDKLARAEEMRQQAKEREQKAEARRVKEGEERRANGHFCTVCGALFVRERDRIKKCPACQKAKRTANPQFKFCIKCGKRFERGDICASTWATKGYCEKHS